MTIAAWILVLIGVAVVLLAVAGAFDAGARADEAAEEEFESLRKDWAQ